MSSNDTERSSAAGRVAAGLLLASFSLGYLLLAYVSFDMEAVLLCLLALAGGGLSFLLALLSLAVGRQTWGRWKRLALPIAVLDLVLLGVLGSAGGMAAVYQVETAPNRLLVMNNLKQLALVLAEYEKEHGTFSPAAAFGEGGRPLVSWRVLILPYLEREGMAEPGLYGRFRLDEPWDGPHNLPLLSRMPRVYAAPQRYAPREPYATFYQVFVGKGAAFEGQRGIPLTDFPDGLSDTILIAVGGEAVPWTKPEELSYADDAPLPKVGAFFRTDFCVAMADGSVQSIHKDISETTLRALITRNRADHPGPDW
jgi:hypothetical protein